MKLKIKDVAIIFNCTTEALRFYEKEGVLVPKRDPENNYRYYGVQHLKILSKCAYFRSVGFSIKEIVGIMKGGTVDNIANTLKSREIDLVLEAERLLEISCNLAVHRNKIEQIQTGMNHFKVVNSPGILLFLNQYNDEVLTGKEYLKVASRFLNYQPFINISILVKRDDVLNNNVWSRHHGYSIDYDCKYSKHFADEELVTVMPSQKCLYTVQSFNLTQEGRATVIKSIREFVETNNYIINGDMIGNQLFADNEKYLKRSIPSGKVYYEYWIPIE